MTTGQAPRIQHPGTQQVAAHGNTNAWDMPPPAAPSIPTTPAGPINAPVASQNLLPRPSPSPQTSRTPYNFVSASYDSLSSAATGAMQVIQPPGLSQMPQNYGNALDEDSAAFSWSPSPRPFPFPSGSQSATIPDSSVGAASSNDPFQSEKTVRGGKKTRGARSGKQASQLQRPEGSQSQKGEGSAGSRDYSRWDKKRESDGLSPEGRLVSWLADGGWKRWKDAKSTGHKDKCCIDINKQLEEDRFEPRSKDAIASKIKAIEDSFKKALTWIHSTGAGSYSLEPAEDGDGRSPYQRELDKRCKYYNALSGAFGERAGMIPKKIYSSIEAQGNREADDDISCALGLRKWDFEENHEEEEEEDDDGQEEDEGDEDGSTRAKKKRRIAASTSGSSATGRSARGAGIVKSEDISAYLAVKSESEKRRIDLDEKKLKLESRKARAESIAIMVKAGLSLEEAKKAWNEEEGASD